MEQNKGSGHRDRHCDPRSRNQWEAQEPLGGLPSRLRAPLASFRAVTPGGGQLQT